MHQGLGVSVWVQGLGLGVSVQGLGLKTLNPKPLNP